MQNSHKKLLIILAMIVICVGSLMISSPAKADRLAQATVAVPTVTGTPTGVIGTIRMDQESTVNVRSGPGPFYDLIGTLLAGQKVNVKGRSSGGDWLYIEYPGVEGGMGWVYSTYVSLTPGTLPIIEPPPTPTPRVTETIDPTLAAQFVVTMAPTRLPTFTAVAPLDVPTYVDASSSLILGGIPVGLVIIILIILGAIIGVFAFVQNR